MQDIARYLADHPFLRGLAPEQTAAVARCARLAEYGVNEPLFSAGEPADGCFLVQEGHVSVEIRGAGDTPIVVQTLGEPGVLGWSWLVPPYRWCFDARALEPTRCIVLEARCLTALCEGDHDFGYELMKRFTTVFAQRLHATRLELLDRYEGRS